MVSDIVVMADSDTREELVPLLEDEFPDASIIGQSSVTFHVNVKGQWGRKNKELVESFLSENGFDSSAVNKK